MDPVYKLQGQRVPFRHTFSEMSLISVWHPAENLWYISSARNFRLLLTDTLCAFYVSDINYRKICVCSKVSLQCFLAEIRQRLVQTLRNLQAPRIAYVVVTK